MTPRREIPGYYFDEARGKYFRIQPNHIAPQGASYSRGAVNAQSEARKLEQETQQRSQRLKQGRIPRSSLYSPFSDLSLNRQLGYRGRSWSERDARCGYYAAELSCVSARHDFRGVEAIGFGLINSQLHIGFCSNSMTPTGLQSVGIYDASAPKQMAPIREMMLHPKQVIAVDETLTVVAGSKKFIMMNSDFPGTWNIGYPNSAYACDMAASPDGSRLAFAINSGLVVYDVGMSPLHTALTQNHHLKHEQMVVSFLDRNIIMSGERTGALNFAESRSNDYVHRLQHSSAINGIYPRNANQIIVSGLQTAAIYDLRYLKGTPARVHPKDCSKCKGGSRRIKHARKKPCTQSIVPPTQALVNFHVPEGCRSHYYTMAGKCLSFIPSLDIAVVASHHRTSNYFGPAGRNGSTGSADRVTLYQASTGHFLPSPLNKKIYPAEVLQVGAHRMRDGPESIFVCTQDHLEEWRVDIPKNAQLEGDDPEEGTEKRGSQPCTMAGDSRDDLRYTLFRDRFPPDAERGIVELWNAGDRGPS